MESTISNAMCTDSEEPVGRSTEEIVQILSQLDEMPLKRFNLGLITTLDIFKQNPRLLIRLKLCVEPNNYYEAHQAYKSVMFRCTSGNQFEDCLELVFNGICYFLENEQSYCGVDLAKSFFETLKKASKLALTKSLIDKISYIHHLLKCSSEERIDFAANILKWSSAYLTDVTDVNLKHFGHPEIHREFAITLWKEKNYPLSRYHFVHSNEGELCAHMLAEFHVTGGYKSEADLFLAQTLLQILCLRNKSMANILFKHYIQIHPFIETKEPPYSMPLLNYLSFLLLSIDDGKAEVFKALNEAYTVALAIDPSYSDFLDKIGQIYFNIKSKKREQANPLNNLFKMFLSNNDDKQQKNDDDSGESNYQSDVEIQQMDDTDLLD